MIDHHLGIPVDAAYREETARLLERMLFPHVAYDAKFEMDAAWVLVRADDMRDKYRHGTKGIRGWSYLAAAHRLEMIARSLETP